MKFLAALLRYSVIFFILGFSVLSIFFTVIERDEESESLRSLISYASYFENRFYDLRANQFLKKNYHDFKSSEIALANIDDQSLQNIGRWPWGRDVWAKFMQKMKAFGVKTVAFDVFFFETEKTCGGNGTTPDQNFAAAIKDFKSIPGNDVILAYSFTDDPTAGMKEVPPELYNYILDAKQSAGKAPKQLMVDKNNFPIQTLLDTEPALSFINATEDSDGIFRHYAMIASSDSIYFPAMGLLAYQSYSNDKGSLEIFSDGTGLMTLKKGPLPLNFHGETKIRFVGGAKNFGDISIKDILVASDNDAEMAKRLSGKILFVGSTAYGAHDLRHTPIDAKMPGVYFHMNLTHMLLHGFFYQPTEKSVMYSLYLLGAMALIFLIVQAIFKNAVADLFITIALAFGAYYLDKIYLLPNGYEIRLFFGLEALIAIYSWTTFLDFYQTSREKKQIRGTFSRYVAPAIVNQMLENPEKLKVGGEKREITCFFSDVRDFTTISEKLSATELSDCLNQYMGAMTDLVFQSGGTLDKYIGDAIVAYWNAPLDIPNHAYHAVKSAVQMIELMPILNEKFKQQGYPFFKIGIGLNTGECALGNMGSNKIFAYTALGDNMNLGARLESLCKYYGVQINISEMTYLAIPEEQKKEFEFRPLDNVKVKGKAKAVKIFEVLHSTHPFRLNPSDLALYREAYQNYQEKNFLMAAQILAELHNKYPEDVPTERLKKYCEHYLDHPPEENWDGSTTMKEK